MSTEQTKKLLEQRAELEKQLRSLTGASEALYMPGMTVVSGNPPVADEQTALQIEELQAAIAEIDEALRNAPQA